MSHYTAVIRWERGTQVFHDNRYSRSHVWRFDGGIEVLASSSPGVVPLPMSRADAVDPEEAFVACLSSCHMLWFLSIAAKRRFIVDAYEDSAEGVMEKSPEGKLAITKVTLHPLVTFSGPILPDPAQLQALHHSAHEQCFIANSVRSEVTVVPRFA